MALQPNSLLEDHPQGTGDLNAIVNGNWNTINNYVNPGAGLTARLDDDSPPGVGSTVNANGNVFTSDDVGATIFFQTDRVNYVIASYVSATKVTITGTGELSAQPFLLYRTGEVERTVLIRGLIKRSRMVSGDNNKVPRWNTSLTRCDMTDMAGYGVTAGRVLLGGGAATDLTSSSDLTFDDSANLLTVNGLVLSKNYNRTHTTITSVSNITAVDFSLNELRSLSLSENTTFTTSNIVAGRQQVIRIVCDATIRTLAFPGWVWLGTAPALIAAGKTGILTLIGFGTNDASVVAKWEVEP